MKTRWIIRGIVVAVVAGLIFTASYQPTLRIEQNQAHAAGTATPTATLTPTALNTPNCQFGMGGECMMAAPPTLPNSIKVCPPGDPNGHFPMACVWATAVPSGGAPIFAHTLTGTTPTAAVNSSTVPAIDIQNELLAANVTSLTLPASSAVADGEEIVWIVKQSASGGPYTIPNSYANNAAAAPLTAGSGTTLAPRDGVYCGLLGTTQSSTTPSELVMKVRYIAALTEWLLEDCSGGPVATSYFSGSSASIAANTTAYIAEGQTSGVAAFSSESAAYSMYPFPMQSCTLSNLSCTISTPPNGTNEPTCCVREQGDTATNPSSQNICCTMTGTNTNCQNTLPGAFPGLGQGPEQGLLFDIQVQNPASANATGIVHAGFMIQCPAT